MTMTLDTIDMTRRIRDSLYEQVKHMTPAERIAFYHAQAQLVHRKLGLPLIDSLEIAASPSEESIQQAVELRNS